MKACCTSFHVAARQIVLYLTNQSIDFPLREFGKYCSLWSSISSPLVTHTLISCQICITWSSLSWYFNSWMHKTFVGMTTMNGFMFITFVIVVGCRIDKSIVFNNSGLGVVPNSSLFNGWSQLPLSL